VSDPIAIIAPAVDLGQIERQVQRAIIAIADAERLAARDADAATASAERAAASEDAAARARVAGGIALIEAKKAVKHGQWLPWLERQGIAARNAQNWMALAGHVSKNESTPSDSYLTTPTQREVNAARREPAPTPLTDDKPSDDWRAEVEARRKPVEAPTREPAATPSIDVDRELSKIVNLIRAVALAVSTTSRKQMAAELREAARTIEAMP
jgi:hypothetical protein